MTDCTRACSASAGCENLHIEAHDPTDRAMCISCNSGMSGPKRKHWPGVQHSACEQGIQVVLGCTKGHFLA